jgi:glycerol-3-phosphate acyltransferase PlsX
LITVAVDCMGGDHGPHVTVPAALEFLARTGDVDVVLVGRRETIEAERAARGAAAGARLRPHHAADLDAMDEPRTAHRAWDKPRTLLKSALEDGSILPG